MIKRVLLVGNPNCGKTTLFNALTGSQQKVGNWPGVTVEKKSGWYICEKNTIEIIDLPGVYSLSLPEQISAKDAQITAQVLMSENIDLIINIVDACHLERHLYLTSQLLELKKPMIVALNMMDMAKQAGIQINTQALSQQLMCPVIALQAHKKVGFDELDTHIRNQQHTVASGSALNAYLPKNVASYLQKVQAEIAQSYPNSQDNALYYAHRQMEQDGFASSIEDIDIVLADARYQMVHTWVAAVQSKSSDLKEQFTAKLDKIFLHRFWGIPLFFTLMYGVFFLAIGVGGAIQTGFDILSQAIFMQTPAELMAHWQVPPWFIQLSAFGIGQALHTLVTFIPVLAIMYFLLAFLEASGYMARVAFIMDRVMRSLGLPGQAFVPLIIGFGCNVPAILAARTMQTERDRFLTVLMNPYMSCSARLAIYAVFVAAFFPNHGYQIIFSLYLLGIGMAVLTGYLARRTFLSGPASPLILELPTYHCPSLLRLCKEAGTRLRFFLLRAGKMIIPLCVILSFLDIMVMDRFTPAFTHIGEWIMPLFAPMGIHADNWPAVISLVTGMLAKEVVIGTLTNLYSQMEHLTHAWQLALPIDFSQTCHDSILAIYEHLQTLFGFTVDQTSEQASNTLPVLLRKNFNSAPAAYAYLLFILLYIPCVSTMAAIRQEATRRLMWFSIAWSIGLAYGCAVSFYQISILMTVQYINLYYLGVGLVLILILWLGLRRLKDGGCHVISRS
ncbi:MAG: ferrous iron transport protein B [Gammaproteobacteria bacterium]